MSQHQSEDLQVFTCTFEAQILSATMDIKFPCTFEVLWKSMNGKILMASTKNKVSAIQSIASFNETLIFETDLLYNTQTHQYLKKDSLLMLNLMSKKRPDQQKLVGRITVDLAEIAN